MAREQGVSRAYAIGLAGRRGVDVALAVELVRTAATQWGVNIGDGVLIAPERAEDRGAFEEIAATLGVSLAFASMEALRARGNEVLTQSPRVKAMFGVGSIAEALALAGVGAGGRLLGPRLATDRLTCAIARAAKEEETA